MATLKQGSSGSSVKTLQENLNDAGYKPKLSVDGKFGPATAAAVRWYQEENDLTVDGVAGESVTSSFAEEDIEGDKLNQARFNGIPGDPEIWKNTTTGDSYIVYFAEGIEPPLPMLWKVPSDKDLEAFFGPDKDIVYDKKISQSKIDATGAMAWGSSTEIIDTEEDPLEGWASRWEREREVRPYLEDPEIYALYASAALEGRSVTEAELESTEWMQTHTEAERRWIVTNASDPLTAQKLMEDNRVATMQRLEAAGVIDVPEGVINYMADQLTTGVWTTDKFDDQIIALTDPYASVKMDAGLKKAVGDSDIGTTKKNEDKVRQLVKRWLGSNFGNWTDQQVADWAGKIRNDGDSEVALLETLKDQREALFPGYDREADYATISAPWKNMMQQAWGELPDDSDKELQNIIKMNDASEAGRYLTNKGLQRGNDTVVNNVQAEFNNAFGGTARG